MSWVGLMEECWSSDRTKRPSFDFIVDLLDDRINELMDEDGVVPTRASEIRAFLKPENQRLDVDTRLTVSDSDPSVGRYETDIAIHFIASSLIL